MKLTIVELAVLGLHGAVDHAASGRVDAVDVRAWHYAACCTPPAIVDGLSNA